MIYVILCGGIYDDFKQPKALSVIKGEKLIDRTIRLLKENGIDDIAISSNTDYFNYTNVRVLKHFNTYVYKDGKVEGYWVDAYLDLDEPCVYLHGDVYYTEAAIKKIINYNACYNTFIGNEVARNKEHKNWGEPFGWIVVDQKKFKEGIAKTKKLQDDGKLERGYAISWELYRVLNHLDPNKQYIYDNTYLSIDDETIDVDTPSMIDELNKRLS